MAPDKMVICCGACAGGGRVGAGDALELSGSGTTPCSGKSRMLSVGENGRSNGVEPTELGSHFDTVELQVDVERHLRDASDAQVESAGLSFANRTVEPAERACVAMMPDAGESPSARDPVFAMELALAGGFSLAGFNGLRGICSIDWLPAPRAGTAAGIIVDGISARPARLSHDPYVERSPGEVLPWQ